jgi:hypothetical protein
LFWFFVLPHMAADQSNQQIIDADCISATRPCFNAA